ncbi:MAG: ribosomal protein S18-alanine N-acetyltransferase [Caldimicrobium sp.]|nr:ribosomal protein S18-alanine N-acetyltransferase [Caldimicrobium sp.]MCX7874126.1 ribosomal protein S18-alanine N-acetyltransferase [Caldimicrobium sp.]MDW8093739.1 ribosomal protein S18-alanine N-acetyltransferase [Caldimicrobium sp.]
MWKEVRAIPIEDPSEIQTLYQIETETFGDLAWSWGMLEGELRHPFSKGLLLRLHSQPLGYALYRRQEREGELLRLAIKPDYQGKGLGKYLLSELFKRLISEGVERLYLEVSEVNQRGLKFYERMGFKLLGKRENYYKWGEHARVLYISLKEVKDDKGCY